MSQRRLNGRVLVLKQQYMIRGSEPMFSQSRDQCLKYSTSFKPASTIHFYCCFVFC